MTRLVFYRLISTHPTTGARRWELSPAALEAVRSYLDMRGLPMESTIRGFRWTKSGAVRFTTGLGYDWKSADLLGGTGDGLALYDFESYTDTRLRELEHRRTATNRRLWREGWTPGDPRPDEWRGL